MYKPRIRHEIYKGLSIPPSLSLESLKTGIRVRFTFVDYAWFRLSSVKGCIRKLLNIVNKNTCKWRELKLECAWVFLCTLGGIAGEEGGAGRERKRVKRYSNDARQF